MQLVDAEGLLKAAFDEQSRPSLRWVRQQQKARSIPYIKIGRLIFFDLEQVKEALARKNTVKAV